MIKQTELAIIGAGPAGTFCALKSAKLGVKTILIEEHPKIGEPVHCGECLSFHATQNTGIKLPKETISKRVLGVRAIFPNQKNPSGKKCTLNEEGFVLEKNIFEQWIAQEAEKNGATVLTNTKAINAHHSKKKWTIKTNKETINAKILADASGATQFTTTQMALGPRSQTITGLQYELTNIPNEKYLDFYINPELAPNGYLWMIPKSNERANVGLVTTQTNNAKKFLDEFLKRMNWEHNKKNKTFGGIIPISGPHKKTIANGLMLIGDAAGFASPMFEGGTHLAMKSAQYSAETAKKALEQNDYTENTLKEYETKWKTEFPPYKKLLHGKKKFYAFTQQELETIANALPKNLTNINTKQKMNFGLNILKTQPTLIMKGLIPAMNTFGYSRAKNYGW
jgi:digeranylgeranylglycerophospholipid reductase